MNDFVHSCNAAATYPKNLISHSEYQHTLQAYVQRLDEREHELFGSEDNAAIDFWDLDDGAASTAMSATFQQRHFGGLTEAGGQASNSRVRRPMNWKDISIFIRWLLGSIQDADICKWNHF